MNRVIRVSAKCVTAMLLGGVLFSGCSNSEESFKKIEERFEAAEGKIQVVDSLKHDDTRLELDKLLLSKKKENKSESSQETYEQYYSENAVYRVERENGFQELWFKTIDGGQFNFLPCIGRENSHIKFTLESGKVDVGLIYEDGGEGFFTVNGGESPSVGLREGAVAKVKVQFHDAEGGGISINNVKIPGDDLELGKEEDIQVFEQEEEDIIDIGFIDYKVESEGGRGDSKSRYTLTSIEKGIRYTQEVAYTSTGRFRTNNISRIDYSLESGKMMLVFYNKNGEIVKKKNIKAGEEGEFYTGEIGEVDLKIVGEDIKNAEVNIWDIYREY